MTRSKDPYQQHRIILPAVASPDMKRAVRRRYLSSFERKLIRQCEAKKKKAKAPDGTASGN